MTTEVVKSSSDDLTYYVAAPTYNQLNRAKNKVIKGDQDRVYVIDGREGVGKSTLAMQLAYSVDPTLQLNQIVFKSEGKGGFEETLRELPKHKALVFDEAFNGLSSKGALSKENKKLIRLLMECRQRNLFIFIVLPTIFLLEKYVAIFRSQALFHCYESAKGVNRRYYKSYNYTNKKILYIKGKNMMSYNWPRINKSYRYYGKFPPTINREEYIKKKLDAFKDLDKVKPAEDNKTKQRTILSMMLKQQYGVKFSDQAKVLTDYGCRVDASVLSRYAKDVPQKLQNANTII